MKIQIPKPCRENWNEMTPQEQGRHCAKCDKVVQDFSQMRDDQIINKVQSGGSTCGRFYNWQLQKDIQLPLLENPWTSWIKKLAVGGFLFGSAVQSKGQDSLQTDTAIHNALHQPQDSLISDTVRTITGQVHQPEDSSDLAKSIDLRIDSFVISINLDSSVFQFDIPSELQPSSLSATLFTEDDTFEFDTIEFSESGYLSVYYDSIWKMEQIAEDLAIPKDLKNDTLTITTSEITVWMGDFITTIGVISMPEQPYVEPFAPLLTPAGQTIDIINRSGIDGNKHVNQPKLNITNKASKDLVVYNKRKSSVWWWLLPIPVLLFFAGYYWKQRQKENSV